MNTDTLKFNGRNVKQKQSFQAEGTFESMYVANRWLRENGYDYGSSCGIKPTAIMKGDYYDHGLPHKWKNLTDQQKTLVDGVMMGDFRDGPVIVYLFN